MAAGTGKLTRLLAPLGAELIAVEPVAGMASQLRGACPGVPLAASTAEALPFSNGALDAITVAQAFHWFDARAALREFARALRPRGRLGLLWNARLRTEPWVDAVWSVMDRVEREAPWRDHERWSDAAFVEEPALTQLQEATFDHSQVLTPEGVVERVRGVSHVAVLRPYEQREVLNEVRAVLAEHPGSRGRTELEIPYRVDAYWCERRA